MNADDAEGSPESEERVLREWKKFGTAIPNRSA